MEKQMIILLLLLSLLLATKGTNFADEWTPVRQPIRDKLASAARHFLGLPYRWGGMSERQRHGLLRVWLKRFLRQLHVDLPQDFPRTISRRGRHRASKTCKQGTCYFFLLTA